MIYNVEALRQACSEGRKFEYLFFWGHTQLKGGIDKSCLS